MIDLPKRILVPTDFSELSQTAARYGAKLALGLHAALHLLYVVVDPLPGGWAADTGQLPGLLDRMAEQAREKLDLLLGADEKAALQVKASVGTGQPADEIVDYAKTNGIELIVMGTHGRGGIEKMWLGSVTEKVLRKVHCPVLVLRQG
jgi:nucleotide-binding universal stress UspA family protein